MHDVRLENAAVRGSTYSGALVGYANTLTFGYSLYGAGINLLADGRLLVSGGSSDGSNNNPVSDTRLIALSATFNIYTLRYYASTGGSLSGETWQTVLHGADGSGVEALPEAGALFHQWSDGRADNPRLDTDLRTGLDVTALFRSTGGADLDWYAARGIAPEPGESWADVDARPVPDKGTTLRYENIADTNPDDPSDRFEILAIDPGPPVVVTFRPGSSERVYTLHAIDDLVSGVWTNVPGAGPRAGEGEGPVREDTPSDENDPPKGPFYRLKVELPQDVPCHWLRHNP